MREQTCRDLVKALEEGEKYLRELYGKGINNPKGLGDVRTRIRAAIAKAKEEQSQPQFVARRLREACEYDPLSLFREAADEIERLAQSHEALREALEDYAKPQRWLRAYQTTGELGLTRCVFTSRGHGFELAQEALSELEEES